MTQPLLIDLFCCSGGAALGYARAGFRVMGVDIDPQPNYPFHFLRRDVLTLEPELLATFDAIHASPPCQGYSSMRHAPGAVGAPKLIDQVREMLIRSGKPYIIENVEGARSEMKDPITLCGTMFGLGYLGAELQRHRLFESNLPISAPSKCKHSGGPVIGVYGGHARIRSKKHGGRGTKDVWPEGHKPAAAAALGFLDDQSRRTLHEMSEAIPPAYTEWLGGFLMREIMVGGQKEAA